MGEASEARNANWNRGGVQLRDSSRVMELTASFVGGSAGGLPALPPFSSGVVRQAGRLRSQAKPSGTSEPASIVL